MRKRWLYLLSAMLWTVGCTGAAPPPRELPRSHAASTSATQVVFQPVPSPFETTLTYSVPEVRSAPTTMREMDDELAGTEVEHATPPLNARYVCPMHPKVVKDEPGKCEKCGMTLKAQKVNQDEEHPR